MKNEYINKNIISITGTLDINADTNELFIRVETKDDCSDIQVAPLLNSLIGKEIQIKSEEDLL